MVDISKDVLLTKMKYFQYWNKTTVDYHSTSSIVSN
jgi:hypothetical protein